MSGEEVDGAVCSFRVGTVIGCPNGESSGVIGCWVDWRLNLSWSRWPLAVASDGVRSDSLIKSMPGHERRKPFFMALRKKETAGLLHVAWR